MCGEILELGRREHNLTYFLIAVGPLDVSGAGYALRRYNFFPDIRPGWNYIATNL